MRRADKRLRRQQRRWWPTPSTILAGAALFVVLGGSAVAAKGLIHAGDIATGAVTSRAIKGGAVAPRDLSAATRALLAGGPGAAGAKGTDGVDGTNGVNGANGANGPNGANGTNGIDGVDGANGANGVNGTNGTNGTIAPLSAKQGATVLPTGSPATTVVELTVPIGSYVVLAKTQLSHSGAGDSVHCFLKAGATTIDQIAMKTLPALAAIPASLQAITTTTSSTQLSVQCNVAVADGAANFSSLIAIPTA
ncbi:MAG TPA: collagen-like protein [Solirubrobacterales bacterium]|nr:collagen-like protein [Solirubrobacterales bacterium]